MSHLPGFDRRLLKTVERAVPRAEREAWRRGWEAELWHAHYRGRTYRAATELTAGLMCDALWLRGESWRRTFEGTAPLCLATLAAMILPVALLALAFNGQMPASRFGVEWKRFVLESVLIIFVSFATSSRRHTQQGPAGGWMRRQSFLIAKIALVLLLSAFVAWDVSEPVYRALPILGELLQIFLFVAFALAALRWAFADQQQRCKQCLRLLATPARVGRPSHNLLEWNGTELVCKQGHGRLSVPEMETSWCRSSEWVTRRWDGAPV